MRIVAGSGLSRDLREAKLERHLEVMAEFIARVKRGEEPRHLTMILRSPAASAAQALLGLRRELLAAGIAAKAVVARLEPEAELRPFFITLSELSARTPEKDVIRWARAPGLLHAHEQATYGTSMCWFGDAMRREADKRDALSRFEAEAHEHTRLGQLAFAALWAASSPISEQRLLRGEMARPSGAYEPEASRMATMSGSRSGSQGWPLIRH